jgi:hypothetical protein
MLSIVPDAIPVLFQEILNLVPLVYPIASSSSPIQNSKNPLEFVLTCGATLAVSEDNSPK